ncbi:hypothetical protein K1719_044394 [Acacia pycnantha]|nr:hypothetical protein K1719_044394 [Acacia pycnantha]
MKNRGSRLLEEEGNNGNSETKVSSLNIFASKLLQILHVSFLCLSAETESKGVSYSKIVDEQYLCHCSKSRTVHVLWHHDPPPSPAQREVVCTNSTVSSVKGYSLPGVLPPQLVKLPYLKEVDFALNYLNGTIPKESLFL